MYDFLMLGDRVPLAHYLSNCTVKPGLQCQSQAHIKHALALGNSKLSAAVYLLQVQSTKLSGTEADIQQQLSAFQQLWCYASTYMACMHSSGRALIRCCLLGILLIASVKIRNTSRHTYILPTHWPCVLQLYSHGRWATYFSYSYF